jgi:hypothetical protein
MNVTAIKNKDEAYKLIKDRLEILSKMRRLFGTMKDEFPLLIKVNKLLETFEVKDEDSFWENVPGYGLAIDWSKKIENEVNK